MRRISTFYLCIIMCLLLICSIPRVYAESYSGTCGQNLTWSFDSKTGELVISGSGEMDDYYYDTPWESFTEKIKTVSIGNSVTSIGVSSFSGCEALTDVTLGSSLKSIGMGAFYNCVNLTSITIPSSVTSIGITALDYCISLTEIRVDSNNSFYSNDEYGILFNKDRTTLIKCPGGYPGEYIIPSGVKSINIGAFENCINLTGVTISDSVTTMGMQAFFNCKAMTNVTIGNGITNISDSAFSNCESLTSVTLPHSVTSISESAFQSCSSLTNVTIPNSVTSIGDSAFHYCSSLKDITIPNSVSSIGDEAFRESGLESMTIPDSITTIPYALFMDCISLQNVIIPNSVATIEKYAFNGCTSLESVTIPDSVTSIGDRTFYQCKSLASVVLPNVDAIIGNEVFQYCTSLTCVTIPSGLTNVGYKMFYDCSALEKLVISEGVVSIEDQAFYGCKALTTVSIPESVSQIHSGAFADCFELTRVTIYNPECDLIGNERLLGYADRTVLLGYSNSTTQKYAQKYGYQFISLDDLPQPFVGSCGTNVNWSLNRVTGEMLLSGSGAMYDYDLRETPWADHSSLICSVVVSDGVTSIGNNTFSGCENLASLSIGRDVAVIGNAAFSKTSLKNIVIPDKVTRIGDEAFFDCQKLKALSISYGVTSIGKNAFAYCYNLQNFIIPDSVESIESGAFDHCIALTSMEIPHKVEIISDSLFLACSGLAEITLPYGIERIGNDAFNSCTGLKNVSIQNGITIIGTGAFRYCENLTDITLPASLISVGDDAFNGCTNLTKVTVENPKCKIYDRVSTLGTVGITVLLGYDNSTVHEYALKYGYRFESLGDSPFEDCTHAYTTVVSQPSCTEQGYTTYTCSLCGESYIDSYVAALGHTWDKGEITLPPTATENGVMTFCCTRCGETETEIIPAMGEDHKPCDGGANCFSKHFTDVAGPNDWTHEGIDFAVSHGLFSGTSATTFKPHSAMTRAMLVTVLWRYAGTPAEGTNSFIDVPKGTWYTDAVAWAVHNGVTTGVSNNKFNPDGNITREQMATILYRYAKSNGINTSNHTDLSSFPDAEEISSYAIDAMQWAVAEGLITGSAKGGIVYLMPQGYATRAQVAAILMRFIQNVVE